MLHETLIQKANKSYLFKHIYENLFTLDRGATKRSKKTLSKFGLFEVTYRNTAKKPLENYTHREIPNELFAWFLIFYFYFLSSFETGSLHGGLAQLVRDKISLCSLG